MSNAPITSRSTASSSAADIQPGANPRELRCSGPWLLRSVAQIEVRIDACLKEMPLPDGGELLIDAQAVTSLDTSGAWLLHRTRRDLEQGRYQVRFVGLRPEFEALLRLIATRTASATHVPQSEPGVLNRIGGKAWESLQGAFGLLSFLGANAIALVRELLQPRRIRWKSILYNLQTAGVAALPITGLLAFLLGIVIAYQGAEQLSRVGANIYIADLVGLSMVRELSPLITAIIIAGRSGSAYAAQIATMKVTEEVDALRTIGIGPLDLLVLPKVFALVIALPLLTVYTDIMGILGGMVMARAQLDVGYATFIDRLDEAVSLTSFLIGIGKAPVFAAIIALVGCYQGFQVSGSAESVGQQTTRSVVQAIFLVILADALFSIAFSWLGI
ncbi:MAG: MlaE family lipid ABC transporter permease subunit [Gallionella sp.]|jgi:phospholipid/cholesterol/gamma-HCH transport system permease protein|nr:MlaE family lipid ABC transporter permease subunit [Gallionella sp.]MCK9353322.1 MlaE family lipid ABC transporter permease subunit [Gallionella sp.]